MRTTDPVAVDAAYRTFEQIRWGDSPRCPHCAARSVSYLPPRTGRRLTRTGAVTARRVWRCANCHRQFSVLTGTVLHGTRTELTVWLAVIDALAAEGSVPPIRRIVREHKISRDAARHLHGILVRCCTVGSVAACLPTDPTTGRR